MALQDYTETGPMIRGFMWPPAGEVCTVRIENTSGWAAGADAWTWTLHISRTQRGGTADLILTALSVAINGNWMVLTFGATPDETESLPSTKSPLYAEVHSDDGSPDGSGVSVYDCVAGTAQVRGAAGEG